MPAEEIVPGIYGLKISGGYVNAFFVIGDDGVTMVDSGLPNKTEMITTAVRSIRSDAQLRDIVITHRHADHIGSLGQLVAGSQARVYAHPLDASMIRGDSPNDLVFTGKGAEHVLHWFALAFGPRHLDPAPVHHEVADGEELEVAGGMRAIHTPGHTIGHVSYLLARQEGNVLFVGDAAANLFGRLSAPQGGHNDDPPAINPSIQKLAELDFDIACFGHGRVLRGGANAAFRRLVEKLSS